MRMKEVIWEETCTHCNGIVSHSTLTADSPPESHMVEVKIRARECNHEHILCLTCVKTQTLEQLIEADHAARDE